MLAIGVLSGSNAPADVARHETRQATTAAARAFLLTITGRDAAPRAFQGSRPRGAARAIDVRSETIALACGDRELDRVNSFHSGPAIDT
jgi:hypothetical protein